MLNNKGVTLLVGAALSAAFVMNAPAAWKTLGDIKNRQVAANERLVEWKASYQALLPINERFKSTFQGEDQAKDLVALWRMFDLGRHGLSADQDSVRQTAAIPVEVNGMQVGLQKLCVSNDGDKMRLSAANMGRLRHGLRSLSQRKDIHMGTIELGVQEGVATAKVSDLCLLIRTGETL